MNEDWTPIAFAEIERRCEHLPPAERWIWQWSTGARINLQLRSPEPAVYDFKATPRGLFLKKVSHEG